MSELVLDERTTAVETDAPPASNPADERIRLVVEAKLKAVKADRQHFSGAFKRVRKSQVFAGGKQWANQTDEDDRYVTNFVVRHINQTVAALYAKNPTMKCQRRKRLDYTLWDGKQSTLTMAMQSIQQTTMAGLPPDPNALALAQEIEMVKADQMMVDRHCMTLELLLAYSMEENRFKRRAKQWVRRAKTAGVAWCRVGYQREFDKKPVPPTTVRRHNHTTKPRSHHASRVTCKPEMLIRWAIPVARKTSQSARSIPVASPTTNPARMCAQRGSLTRS